MSADSGPGLKPVAGRPRLSIAGNAFYVNHAVGDCAAIPARVVFRRDWISVGCTDADPEALRELLKRYDEWASEREYVVQP